MILGRRDPKAWTHTLGWVLAAVLLGVLVVSMGLYLLVIVFALWAVGFLGLRLGERMRELHRGHHA